MQPVNKLESNLAMHNIEVQSLNTKSKSVPSTWSDAYITAYKRQTNYAQLHE